MVTAEAITSYCSVDKNTGSCMIDKKDAEDLGLLKIDALGLRTLSVIQDTLDAVGWSREQLLAHPLDDQKALDVIRHSRFSGIFQFEGFALQSVCRQMPIEKFEDMCVITALARPGPLTSGGTGEFIKRRTGTKEINYIHPMMEKYTKLTYGTIVYQEQVMQIAREVGKLSWEDVSNLRKAMSKSLGKEYFDTFKVRFVAGAAENGINDQEAGVIWDNINTMGSWSFNRSHAVAYGMVSYWCCIMKANFPLEFAAATLRNSKDTEQVIQIIRDLVKEGYSYKTVDPDKSGKNWAAVDGALVGGLTNVKGIGVKLAEDIIKRRAAGVALTLRQKALLDHPVTPYDNIFEARQKYGHIYDNFEQNDLNSEPVEISSINDHEDGVHLFLGKIVAKNLRDLNEAIAVQKRGGRVFEKHTEQLNLDVADDTGKIKCSIGRFDFARLGKQIVEEGKIGDWYIWKGHVRKGFLQVQIKQWRKLS